MSEFKRVDSSSSLELKLELVRRIILESARLLISI